MFTGLVQNLGQVRVVSKRKTFTTIDFSFKKKEAKVKKGESIAVNGACLTAARISPEGFQADIIPETLAVTNLGKLKVGDIVNIERSLRMGDPIGGHFLTGHVDALGKVAKIEQRSGNWRLLVYAPKTIISKLAVKDSIACEGVSLTVQSKTSTGFRVAVIPHTLAVTTLGRKKEGDEINLETDKFSRTAVAVKSKHKLLSLQTLRKQGF